MSDVNDVVLESEPGILRVCVRCKHTECPCCGDWCDVCLGGDDDDHPDCANEMECKYDAPPDPRVAAFMERVHAELGDMVTIGVTEALGLTARK